QPVQAPRRSMAASSPMEHVSPIGMEARLFVRLALVALLGFAFYHAHLPLGLLDSAVLFKPLAVAFLLVAMPLPIIALNGRKLFPDLGRTGRRALAFATVLLLFHHFLMTFVFVVFPRGEAM